MLWVVRCRFCGATARVMGPADPRIPFMHDEHLKTHADEMADPRLSLCEYCTGAAEEHRPCFTAHELCECVCSYPWVVAYEKKA